MNTHKLKLSLLGSLLVTGVMIGQAQAASISSGKSATVDVIVANSSITEHTLNAVAGSIAAGAQTAAITAADGEVIGGANDELSIKWDESACTLDAGSALICTVPGKVTPSNTAKFSLHTQGAALAAVAGVTPTWYSNGTKGDFKYTVTLDAGQTVNADTYKLVVAAGVVTP